MPENIEPTENTETPQNSLGKTSVSRLWIEGTLLSLAAACAFLTANQPFMDTGQIDIRTLVGLIGVIAPAILGYMNRNAARHSAQKEAGDNPEEVDS